MCGNWLSDIVTRFGERKWDEKETRLIKAKSLKLLFSFRFMIAKICFNLKAIAFQFIFPVFQVKFHPKMNNKK